MRKSSSVTRRSGRSGAWREARCSCETVGPFGEYPMLDTLDNARWLFSNASKRILCLCSYKAVAPNGV
jgi:hypothetical protein